jgi:hypothetical protein
MTGVSILREAIKQGAHVVFDPSGTARLFAPPDLHERIKSDREAVKEVLRRAALFREQARTPGPVPYLMLPDRLKGDGCLSCGATVPRGHVLRCPACALAVRIALNQSTKERA